MARPTDIAIRNLKRPARRALSDAAAQPDPSRGRLRNRGQRPLTFAVKAVTSKVPIILTRPWWSSVFEILHAPEIDFIRASM
jgi:hypothetical protein